MLWRQMLLAAGRALRQIGTAANQLFEFGSAIFEDCGTKFEKLIRRSSDLPECPSCGQKHLAPEHSTFAAHAGGGSKSADMPVCPSGRCSNPGMCGMN